jgi:hypothetical protein
MTRNGTDKHFVGMLGDLVAQRRQLFLNCNRVGCGHSVEIPIAEAAERHGLDYPMQRFMERARCSRCGARLPEISLTAPPRDTHS